MDWWTTSMGGQRSVGTFAGDQTTCGAHLDVATGGNIFDPWLSSDDLDLGAILNQASCTNTAATTAAAAAAASTPSLTIASVETSETKPGESLGSEHQLMSNSILQNNHHPHQTADNCHAATHSRSPAENKRHIISMISSSLSPAAHQHQQHHQQQQPVGGLVSRQGGSSVAGSPISSSMGSSPINNHAHYLSSPHSCLSSPTTTTTTTTTTAATTPHIKHNYKDSPTSARGSGVCNSSTGDCTKLFSNVEQQQQQQQQSSYFPEFYTIEGVENEASQTNRDQPPREVNGETYMLQTNGTSRTQLVYQDNIIMVACPQPQQQQQYQLQQHQQLQHQQQHQQHRTAVRSITTSTGGRSNCSGGSSLLSALPTTTSSTGNQKQTAPRRLISKAKQNNETPQKIQSQKTRRCRNITDYVLSEEEKRLLIKEGHLDFPMNCRARPLTKNEERVLRKIRRKIRNKKSAQCSRQRKKEYVEELERKYTLVVRENEELRQLLAGNVSAGTKFIDQAGIVTAQQERNDQQEQRHLHHQPQQQTLFDDDNNHQRIATGQHLDKNFLNTSQSSDANSVNQMNWRDLFPQAQQQQRRQL